MPFPFDPSPTILWTLTDNQKLASCEVAFVPIGVQARVLRNGELLYSRIFTKALSVPLLEVGSTRCTNRPFGCDPRGNSGCGVLLENRG